MGNTSSTIQQTSSRVPVQSQSNVDEPSNSNSSPLNLTLPPFSPSRYSGTSASWRRRSTRLSSEPETLDRPLDTAVADRPYDPEDRLLFPPDTPLISTPRVERVSNWRHSTMSRLGSRFLPDSVARNLINSGEESHEEGQALRQGLSSRSRSSVYSRRVTPVSNDRFSLTNSLRRRTTEPLSSSSASSPAITPDRRSIRTLFRSNTNHQLLPETVLATTNSDSLGDASTDQSAVLHPPRRTRTRLTRIRQSVSLPFVNILGSSSTRLSNRRLQVDQDRPSNLNSTTEDPDQMLIPSQRHDDDYRRSDVDEGMPHELDAVEPEARNILSSSRVTSGMSTIRRFPRLRSRSTRLIGRTEHPPLSQVLQLAAAAIAAQLSGASVNGSEPSRTLGGETWDGNIQNFVRTLQEAASAQAGEHVDLNAAESDLPPVNFMRVFQFPNDENGTPMAAQSETAAEDQTIHVDNDRSVTLVLVGVRSMPNVQDEASTDRTIGPSLDTLLTLPFLPPANVLRNGTSGALFRRSDNRASARGRRHSMTNFPQQYEGQRYVRRSGTRTSVESGLLTPLPGVSSPIFDSPPGPNPPPSTPADMRSGHATPIRRPSSASLVQNSALPNVSEDQASDVLSASVNSDSNTARQRRRSDSEFARRPELSSGNSRRNGVVEPDRSATGSGRSWLIYVVGTNVSPDHPAFTMPSLFTDNPSFEDMQMLSTLLGPVKPPVASQADVAAAGGLYRVALRNGNLIAECLTQSNDYPIQMNLGDRCLICLCEYEENDQVRRINSCHHVYHSECVDEWLTTGRNSCPMCRGQGVKENICDPASTSNSAINSSIEGAAG